MPPDVIPEGKHVKIKKYLDDDHFCFFCPRQESKKKCCQSICETVLTKQEAWKTGITKMFLKVR